MSSPSVLEQRRLLLTGSSGGAGVSSLTFAPISTVPSGAAYFTLVTAATAISLVSRVARVTLGTGAACGRG